MLTHVSRITGAKFNPCFFRSLASTSALQLAGLNFLHKQMSTAKITHADLEALCAGDYQGILICLNSLLSSTQTLVNRSAMDLLLAQFPFELSKLLFQDIFLQLIEGVLGLLLKRDMSLNRRVYNWLKGGEENVRLISNCIIGVFDRNNSSDRRVFEILISLLDQPLGILVMDHVFIDMLRFTEHHSKNDSVLSIANTLFDSLDPFFIWKRLFIDFKENKNVPLLI